MNQPQGTGVGPEPQGLSDAQGAMDVGRDEGPRAPEGPPAAPAGAGPGPSKARGEELDGERLKSVLESLIFVADQPVTAVRLARAVRVRVAAIRPLLTSLQEDYAGHGLELAEVGGGWQFRSATANARFVRTFVAAKPVRLTRAQLEVLSITAYRQPVTRPEMDEIRGVDCGSAIKILLERGLLRILGRKEEPGRPLLYGTTPYFLEFFGLSSLSGLPTLKEFTDLSDESRAFFEQKMGDALADGELERLTRESSTPPPADEPQGAQGEPLLQDESSEVPAPSGGERGQDDVVSPRASSGDDDLDDEADEDPDADLHAEVDDGRDDG